MFVLAAAMEADAEKAAERADNFLPSDLLKLHVRKRLRRHGSCCGFWLGMLLLKEPTKQRPPGFRAYGLFAIHWYRKPSRPPHFMHTSCGNFWRGVWIVFDCREDRVSDLIRRGIVPIHALRKKERNAR
jgi:hypothetical protein